MGGAETTLAPQVRESVYPMEKVCTKAAKDMYEHARKLEHDFKHALSGERPVT